MAALPRAVARTLVQLALSCHPAPTVAVTAFATILGAVAGNPAPTCVLIGAAVCCGQLSIGWSNDRLDRERDAASGRADKPVAIGALPLPVIDAAVAVALAGTLVLSALLGEPAGLLNLATVACGWIYNLGVKGTWWSWLPYALAFGALPAVVTTALPDPREPGVWAMATGALLGVAANLTNALPDLVGDERAGMRGLPHRIGARASLVLAAALLLGATLSAALGPPDAPAPISWFVLALVVAALLLGLPRALREPLSRASFAGIIAIAALDLLLIVVTGDALR